MGTASNYSVIVSLHTLQITDTNTKSSSACSAFTTHFLVTACNSGDTLASVLRSFPADHRLTLNSDFVPWL
jgi:hypothetical protein